MRVVNPFDSHVHWKATGENSFRFSLKNLKNADDIANQKIHSHYYRKEWLLGFSWDHNSWQPATLPDRAILDNLFPNNPVCFNRIDGHAIWVNSQALKLAGILDHDGNVTDNASDCQGGAILKDVKGVPTGILLDHAMEKVRKLIPRAEDQQIRSYLLEGNKIFNKAGITHVRNMNINDIQWQQACKLDQANELTLAVEQYFSVDNGIKDFDATLKFAQEARKDSSSNLRVKGIKVYYDGALGSDGALISYPYHNSTNCYGPNWKGLQLSSYNDFSEMLLKSWEKDFELAVHAIGDEAVHQVVSCANALWDKGLKGTLNIEHAQIVRDETIDLMRDRSIICHMQPCHWSSDKNWVFEKVPKLKNCLFPWHKIEQTDTKIFFGSDSPIEPSSICLNEDALNDAENMGIPSPRQRAAFYHTHPDTEWTPDTFCEFKDGKVTQLSFRGKIIDL